MDRVVAEIRNKLDRLINSHYYINMEDPIDYPYLVFNYTLSLRRAYSTELYIDFNIFDNQGADSTRLEKTVSGLYRFINDKTNTIYHDDFYILFDDMTVNNLPTESDVLQRRTGTINTRIEWRNI